MSADPTDRDHVDVLAAASITAHRIAINAVLAEIESEGVRVEAGGQPVYDISAMFDEREHSPDVIDMASQAVAYAAFRGFVRLLEKPPLRVRILRRA